MIRKFIIVVLTMAAVGTGFVGGVFLLVSGWGEFGNIGELYFGTYGGAIVISSGPAFMMGPGELRVVPWFSPLGSAWLLGVPLWIPFLLLATYPAFAFTRGPLRRYRRRKRGLCVT